MKLIVILTVISCSYSAKLDRTYLPPPGAATSGGDIESLFVPLEPKSPISAIGQSRDRKPSQPISNGNQRVTNLPSGDRNTGHQNTYAGHGTSDEIKTIPRAGSRSNVDNPSGEILDISENPSHNEPQFNNLPVMKDLGFNGPGMKKYSSSNNPTFTERVQKPERAQAANDRAAEIVKYDTEIEGDSYHYSYETSNGISAEEKGIATNGVQAEGSYSYTGDDGKFYSVTYTADENGFQPHGEHLPTSPPIPEIIIKSIEDNAKAAANGAQDGAYEEDYDGKSTPGNNNVPSKQYSYESAQSNNEPVSKQNFDSEPYGSNQRKSNSNVPSKQYSYESTQSNIEPNSKQNYDSEPYSSNQRISNSNVPSKQYSYERTQSNIEPISNQNFDSEPYSSNQRISNSNVPSKQYSYDSTQPSIEPNSKQNYDSEPYSSNQRISNSNVPSRQYSYDSTQPSIEPISKQNIDSEPNSSNQRISNSNVPSKQYSYENTQSNNELPKQNYDPVSSSSYEHKSNQPSLEKGYMNSDLKSLSNGPTQRYFEESQNSGSQPTQSSGTQINYPVIKQTGPTTQSRLQKDNTAYPNGNKDNGKYGKNEENDYSRKYYPSSQQKNVPSDSVNQQQQYSKTPSHRHQSTEAVASGYQYNRPSQPFDSHTSQTTGSPISVAQQPILIEGINKPNIIPVSQDFSNKNSGNRVTGHNSNPDVLDIKNNQYTTPNFQVSQNTSPNNSLIRQKPKDFYNNADRKQHTSDADISISRNGPTTSDSSNYVTNIPNSRDSQHTTPQYRDFQRNNLSGQRSQDLTPESHLNEHDIPSTSTSQGSQIKPKDYYYNPSQKTQFSASTTPETNFSESTLINSPKSYEVNTPKENNYSSNTKNIVSNIPSITQNRLSQNISPTSVTSKYNPSQNQDIASNNKIPRISQEQMNRFPSTTPKSRTNLVNIPSYQNQQNNINYQEPQNSATTVYDSRNPISNYHQQGNDEGYQYNRPSIQGIDYNSLKGNQNISPNSYDLNSNTNIDSVQNRKPTKDSFVASTQSPNMYSDSSIHNNFKVPDVNNNKDNISSGVTNQSPRQYNNGRNEFRPAGEDFSGPRQPPSFSSEEGYKY